MNKVKRAIRRDRIAAGTATEFGRHKWERRRPHRPSAHTSKHIQRAEERCQWIRERNLRLAP